MKAVVGRCSGIYLLCSWVAERKMDQGQPLGLCQGCSLHGALLGLTAGCQQRMELMVGALVLDAECCCVVSLTQRLANNILPFYFHL